MKEAATAPLTIPPETAAKCGGPDQLANFDQLVRAVMTRGRMGMATSKPRPKKQPKRIRQANHTYLSGECV